MNNLKSNIKYLLFIAALALTPYVSVNADSPSQDQSLIAERGGHGGGRGGHGGGHHGGGHRGGGNWGHHGGNHGNWGHHGNWNRNHWRGGDDFYGFGFWGWPNGYEAGYQNTSNCYYYQASDGNWYYTCSGY